MIEITTNEASQAAGILITPEARAYALQELATRAGVQKEFFEGWKVFFQETCTIVNVQPPSGKKIIFRNVPQSLWNAVHLSNLRTVRTSWMGSSQGHIHSIIPDFVVPFSPIHQQSEVPLFSKFGLDTLECRVDLLASILLTLGRYEETLPSEPDQHGRFQASSSVSVKDNFLHRPIIDEYGAAFEQALSALVPAWISTRRQFRVKLTHDIDAIGIPFRLRSSLGHVPCLNPLATATDFFGLVTNVLPAYLQSILRIVTAGLERGLTPAVYWKYSAATRWDTGYDLRHPKVQRVISTLREKGVELGIHPGYFTYRNFEELQRQVTIVRETLNQSYLGGRQHYLRWSPDTWYDWERCGLSYDSTVGFAERIGFRAGTCVPYRPWLFEQNRPAALVEIPLIVMDCSLTNYMGLNQEQSVQRTLQCIDRCRDVGGVFTLNWHNTSITNPAYGDIYTKILDTLAGEQNYSAPGSES